MAFSTDWYRVSLFQSIQGKKQLMALGKAQRWVVWAQGENGRWEAWRSVATAPQGRAGACPISCSFRKFLIWSNVKCTDEAQWICALSQMLRSGEGQKNKIKEGRLTQNKKSKGTKESSSAWEPNWPWARQTEAWKILATETWGGCPVGWNLSEQT